MSDIEKLGRYDIVRVLGKGAMGVVYEGRDPNLERKVAIKTIRVQGLSPAAATEYEGRFRTEARSAARLHHPNIVSVFDSGQDGDTAYLVLEFINGEDLKSHLANGARFSVRSSIAMAHDLLMALDHAHRQNVVHRDVKPANLLIELSGKVKLTDFGVARIQEPDEAHLTQVGITVGTPKYMSPEQAKGLRGDSRSDVFSAAVVLYELLTGALPFDGQNQFMVIHQIVGHEPTQPSLLNPEVPSAMDQVMSRAMAKNPEERYATAGEFALALRAAFGDGVFGAGSDLTAVAIVSQENELGRWNKIKDSVVSQHFLEYIARYPSGVYARRAQQRLDQLALDDTFTRAETVPHFRPQADEAPVDKVMADPSPETGSRSRFKWTALAIGLALLGALALGFFLWSSLARSKLTEEVVVSESAAGVPGTAPVAASKPASEPRPTKPKASPPSSQGGGAGPSAPGQVCSEKMFILRIPCVAEQCKTARFSQTAECVRFRNLEKKREDGETMRQR